MLTYAEIRAVLLSLERRYEERASEAGQMDDSLSNSKWVLRDVNREVIKKFKKKYGGN
jgi:hypothetical protein